MSRMTFKVRGKRTLNERIQGLNLAAEVWKYFYGRTGALSVPAGVAYGFVRTRPELETPDVQYHIAHASFRNPKERVPDDFPGLTIGSIPKVAAAFTFARRTRLLHHEFSPTSCTTK